MGLRSEPMNKLDPQPNKAALPLSNLIAQLGNRKARVPQLT
jgi:hypothetical protein